jgi:hypothetical protein
MSRRIQKAIGVTISSLIFSGIIASNAVADTIQIPAVAFAQRASSIEPGVAQFGTLTTAEGKYYAAVPFPYSSNGDFVCSFKLIHRDNDAELEVIARLFKKRILVGQSPFGKPVRMAQARSGAGAAVTAITVVSDTSIAGNPLVLNSAFYYVELEITGTTVEVLGVQIEYGPVC